MTISEMAVEAAARAAHATDIGGGHCDPETSYESYLPAMRTALAAALPLLSLHDGEVERLARAAFDSLAGHHILCAETAAKAVRAASLIAEDGGKS